MEERCFFFLFILLLVFLSQQDPLKPISRIDIVPLQRINEGEVFKAGVVAFHKEGIKKVSFSIKGQGYTGAVKETNECEFNPRTNVWEYYVNIPCSEFICDGNVTIEVIVEGNDGGIRDKSISGVGMDPVKLIVNPLGSLRSTKIWVSNEGDDELGVEVVNDPSKSVRSLWRALELLEEYNLDVFGDKDLSGCYVYFHPGLYYWYSERAGLYPSAKHEWVTLANVKGTVVIQVKVIDNQRQGFAIQGYLKIQGITLRNTGDGIVFYTGSEEQSKCTLWLSFCKLIGHDHVFDSFVYAHNGNFFKHYYTDIYVKNTYRGLPGGHHNIVLVRNIDVHDISDDAFQNIMFVVNARIDNMRPKCPEGHEGNTNKLKIDGGCDHSDIIQLYNVNGDVNQDNSIFYGIKATNIHGHGFFIRGDVPQNEKVQVDGMALVNIYYSEAKGIRDHNVVLNSFLRSTNHLLWYHISSPTLRTSIYEATNITNFHAIGNIFQRLITFGLGEYSFEFWKYNHIIYNDYNLEKTPGVNITYGETGVYLEGGLQGSIIPDSIFTDRFQSIIPNDVCNRARGDVSDMGAIELNYEYDPSGNYFGCFCDHDKDKTKKGDDLILILLLSIGVPLLFILLVIIITTITIIIVKNTKNENEEVISKSEIDTNMDTLSKVEMTEKII